VPSANVCPSPPFKGIVLPRRNDKRSKAIHLSTFSHVRSLSTFGVHSLLQVWCSRIQSLQSQNDSPRWKLTWELKGYQKWKYEWKPRWMQRWSREISCIMYIAITVYIVMKSIYYNVRHSSVVSAPACHLVGPMFGSWPGTLGIPSLSNWDEDKRNGLRKLAHIQCGVIIKYCESPT